MFARNSGILCPAPLTQNCPVDCVGSWGACAGPAPQSKTYNWTTLPLNGGSTATCAYPNGQTDTTSCGATCHFHVGNLPYMGPKNAILCYPDPMYPGPDKQSSVQGMSCAFPGNDIFVGNCWQSMDGFRAYCNCY